MANKRPRALDLFCGAGGAGMGLHRAGFDVIGVDIKPQPRYPFAFIQGDALKPPVRLSDFDLVWASPPCQAHSSIAKQNRKRRPDTYHHPDLVADTRALISSARTWVIENVIGAPLVSPVMLCGSMFGLDVKRHRIFEAPFLIPTGQCVHRNHAPKYRSLDKRRAFAPARFVGVHGHLNYAGEKQIRQRAMGIDWMNDYELTQSIPPDYSEHVGRYALMALNH